MLPEFDLLTPQTLPEALDLLDSGSPHLVPLAGGTNLIVDLRDRRRQAEVLMDVSRLAELQGVRRADGHIVVGGGTTIADLLNDPLVAEYGAPLRDAARAFAGPLVRNRATVAGNLVDASPAADTAPPLLVLDAEVELVSRAGTRRIPLDEFLVGVRETLRQPNELLSAVRWPIPPVDSVAAYHKLGLRKADAISVLSVALKIECDEQKRCHNARIALGAVAPRPLRAYAAEEKLNGQKLTSDLLTQVARQAAEATRPIDDIRGSAAYRRRVVEVLVRRLLAQVADQSDNQEASCGS
jgi:carbon-monoxide dehydrogenase medium subunit